MRVLHVTHQYPPAIGGSERYIADLSEVLASRGHKIDVYTTRSLDFHTWRNELPGFEHRNGVDVTRFRSMRRTRFVWSVLHYGLRHYWRTRKRRYEPFILFGGGPIAPGLYRALRRLGHRYDLVHLNCLVYSHVAYGYTALRGGKIPIVVTPHLHIDQPATYDVGYMRRLLLGVDHTIAVTEAERQHLLRLGLDSWRVTTAGNGIRPEMFPVQNRDSCRDALGLPREAFVVLFFGRKESYKGAGRVLEAYASIRSAHPDMLLITAGPTTDFWRGMTAEVAGLPGWRDYPAVSDEERSRLMGAADVLALPSEGEAFGIVFLEAWMMGAAVLGPRNPAVASVVSEGVDGLLAAPGRVDEVAACLHQMAQDRERTRSMGIQGRRKVLQRYTVDRLADVVEGTYMRAVRDRRRGIRDNAS